MRKTIVAAMVSAVVVLVGTGAAFGVDYPVSEGTLEVSDTTVAPGSSVTVSGDGCAPGASVEVVFTSSPVLLATTTANGAGAINASVTIPSDAEAGSHTLSATCADPVGGTLVLRASLTVEGSTGSILGLPRTGGNIAALAIVAAAIFLVGGLFVVVTRRRTAHAES